MATNQHHPKTRGLNRILRDNGWTPEYMQAEWDRAVAALDAGCPGTTFRAFAHGGFSWDTLPAHLLPKLPGLADRLYERKAEADAEEARKEARKKAEADARRYYLEHTEEVLVGKIDAGEQLSEDELDDFLTYLEHYDEDEGENRRWTRSMTTYLRTKDGRFFRLDWEQGLTEMQEDCYWEQPVEVELHEEEKVIRVIERTWTEVSTGKSEGGTTVAIPMEPESPMESESPEISDGDDDRDDSIVDDDGSDIAMEDTSDQGDVPNIQVEVLWTRS